MGAASRTTVIPPPCESAASQYRVGLVRLASGRVLVVEGGVFECSSRMNGKPSSPVLRGLGASDGARLLDPNRVTSEWPVIRPQSFLGPYSVPCESNRFCSATVLCCREPSFTTFYNHLRWLDNSSGQRFIVVPV